MRSLEREGHNMRNGNADFFKDLLIGAVGGLIGTVVLERISSKLYEWEDEQARRKEDELRKVGYGVAVAGTYKVLRSVA
jgi:hypothetical protein